MKISLAQLDVCYKNKVENIRQLRHLLATSSDLGEIILLPELFSTGYIFDTSQEIHELSETITDSTIIADLQIIATEYKITIVAGIAEKDKDQYFNSVVIVNETGVQATYRKIAQTNIDKRYFSRGNNLVTVCQSGVTFGILICFDIWFPELVRAYVNRGVDVLLHPANFGGQQSFIVANSRAIENNIMIATCNRIGSEQAMGIEATYCGGSQLVDGSGNLIVKAGSSKTLETVEFPVNASSERAVLGVNLNDEISEINALLKESSK